MRIDLFNATLATPASTPGSKVSADTSRNQAVSHTSPTEDTTSLSSSSDSVSSLTQSALQSVSSRADKVSSLKQAVASGQYRIDPAKIAQALSNSDV